MKKLLMTMMAVTALATAHAAQINWATGGLSGLANPGGGTFTTNWEGASVYFFLCDASFDTQLAIDVLKAGGGLAGLTGEGFESLIQATFVNQPRVNPIPTAGTGNVGDTTPGYVIDERYSGFAIIFDNSGSYVAVSRVATSTQTMGPSTNLPLPMGGGANFGVHEIIPEPATAMLALAGIGLLLAQKRKRA